MTLVSFFGCSFIAFGPAFAMFTLTVTNDAQQVIVLISSAFFWLLSLLLSSMWWTAVVPMRKNLAFTLFFSVIFQELFRFFLWKVLRKAEEGLITMTNSHSPLRKLRFHYVSGLGFGLMSGLFSMVNILADITGPGTVGLFGENHNFVIISAFLTNCMILLHTFWGIVFFGALDVKKWRDVAIVIVTHLLFSGLTLLNQQRIYWPALTVGYLTVVAMGIWSFYYVGGSIESLKRSFKSSSSVDLNT